MKCILIIFDSVDGISNVTFPTFEAARTAKFEIYKADLSYVPKEIIILHEHTGKIIG